MRTPYSFILESIELGPIGNLIYFFGDPKTRQVAVIDPAWDPDAILKKAKTNNWQIVAILLTHGHPDHINAVADLVKASNGTVAKCPNARSIDLVSAEASSSEAAQANEEKTPQMGVLRQSPNIPVYLSQHEAKIYQPDSSNLHFTADHSIITVGNIQIECLHTPGHTPGCQCFKIGKILFTGDTLFVDACGRCDLPGGNAATMFHTLHDIISRLPDDTVIFPGHSYGPKPSDTLGEQKKTNPFLRLTDKTEFLEYLGG